MLEPNHKAQMLNDVRMLTGTDKGQDLLLGWLLEDTYPKTVRLCRLPVGKQPDGFDGLVCKIVADIYRAQRYGKDGEQPVTAYTEGQRSWTFAKPDERTIAEVFASHDAELALYRRMGW